jgi:hypothetical protein
VPYAAMRTGDTHPTAAEVSRPFHAGDDVALCRIEDGDAAREIAAGEREGRKCKGTDGAGCLA